MVYKTALLSLATITCATQAYTLPAWLVTSTTTASTVAKATALKATQFATAQATSAKIAALAAKEALVAKANVVGTHVTTGAHACSNAVSTNASALYSTACLHANHARAVATAHLPGSLQDVKNILLTKDAAKIGAGAALFGTVVYFRQEIKNALKAGYNKIASRATRS